MAGCAADGLLIALLASTPVPAPVPAPAIEPAPIVVPAPSMELLLHLAEFGDAQDRYLDPAELDAAATQAELERESGAAAEESDDDAP